MTKTLISCSEIRSTVLVDHLELLLRVQFPQVLMGTTGLGPRFGSSSIVFLVHPPFLLSFPILRGTTRGLHWIYRIPPTWRISCAMTTTTAIPIATNGYSANTVAFEGKCVLAITPAFGVFGSALTAYTCPTLLQRGRPTVCRKYLPIHLHLISSVTLPRA